MASRQLVLAGVKANTKPEVFDGTEAALFNSWKANLELEVEGLGLNAAEWLDVLAARTSGVAREIVRAGKRMGLSDPQMVVEHIWQEFGERYRLQPSGADEIMRELHQFREVSRDDPGKLWKFASTCRRARIMATEQQGDLCGC